MNTIIEKHQIAHQGEHDAWFMNKTMKEWVVVFVALDYCVVVDCQKWEQKGDQKGLEKLEEFEREHVHWKNFIYGLSADSAEGQLELSKLDLLRKELINQKQFIHTKIRPILIRLFSSLSKPQHVERVGFPGSNCRCNVCREDSEKDKAPAPKFDIYYHGQKLLPTWGSRPAGRRRTRMRF